MPMDFVPSISDKPLPDLEPLNTITYETEFGSISNKSASVITQSELPELSQNDYVFEGWYYDSNFTSRASIGDEVSSNITLYAKWTMIKKPSELELFLSDMGNAIREVKGTNELINAQDMSKEVRKFKL